MGDTRGISETPQTYRKLKPGHWGVLACLALAFMAGLAGLPQKAAAAPPVPTITADAAIVVDYDTGEVVYSKSPDAQYRQASVTKLMTLLLLKQYDPELNDTITVSANADATTGTTANLLTGEVISVGEIVYGLMLPSGNDAAVAIAEYVGQAYLGGADATAGYNLFVSAMNTKAAALGMTNTNYVTPHGMDMTGHYSSARDTAILAKEVFSDPTLKAITGTDVHLGQAISGGPASPHGWFNTNFLLSMYPGTIAGKTGTTNLAGACLVVLHERGGRKLIAVGLGSATSSGRYDDAIAILTYAHEVLGTAGDSVGASNHSHLYENTGFVITGYFPLVYVNGYGSYSQTAGNFFVYKFYGNSVEIIGPKTSGRGKMDLSLDGNATTTIDLYSPTTIKGATIYSASGLSEGFHTVRVTVRSDKNPSSSGTTIAIDGFRTTGSSADIVAPTVTVTSPSASATVSGSSVAVTSSASDNVGVAGVRFYYDDASHPIGSEDTGSPYSVTWDTTGISDGAHTVFAVARDAAGNTATSSAVSVTVSNVVPDTTPPVRSAGSPSGTLPAGTTSASLTLSTDEVATCRYGTTPGTAYASMSPDFTATSSTTHSSVVTGLSNGASYAYYVRCQDGSGNANTDDFSISFTVDSPPVSSGNGGGGIVYSSIYQIKTVEVGSESATVSWLTDILTDSRVEYGTTTAYSYQTGTTTQSTGHTVALQGLMPSTRYYYRVISKSALYGSVSTSSDYIFTTATASPVSENPAPEPPPQELPGNEVPNSQYPARLIKDGATYYLVAGGQRRGVANPGLLFSHGFEFKDAVAATTSDLALPLGENLGPGEGSLVKSPKDNTVYLISGGKKHAFVSADIFRELGYRFSSVLLVTSPELEALSLGGLLEQGTARHMPGMNIVHNGTVYWVGETHLNPYPSLEVYNSWNIDNDFSTVVPANEADLALPLGEPVTLRELDNSSF